MLRILMAQMIYIVGDIAGEGTPCRHGYRIHFMVSFDRLISSCESGGIP